ncbi:MAG TPA: DUF885 domain-containing protein [Candidatus Limnocylindria bacterium]|nr:DUF885 domain-containing protein [Candidatus Limnocylindria bacterium]
MAQAAPRFVSLAPDGRPQPRTTFGHALHRFLDDFFGAEPVWATQIGFHAYDDRWPDTSEAGRAQRLAMLRHHRARLEQVPEEELSRADKVDCGVVLEAIEQMEFSDATLRSDAWDPLSYVYLMGSGLFGLLAREFAPWAHRGAAVAGRVEGLPRLLAQAREALVGLPDRPVSRLHTETAARQLSGVNDLIEQALDEAQSRAAAGDAPELLDLLRTAAQPARQALAEFQRALETDILERSEGEGRLGPELFAAKLQRTLGTDIPPDELLDRAWRDYEAVRAEMVRLSRELWPQWLPAEPMLEGDDEIVRRVLDAIAQEHRRPDELLEWCTAEVGRIEDFCRERDVIGLPDEPLKVTWTPVFMRAYGGAFLESPGVLDKGLSSYFWVTPPDESKGAEAVESYLREENDRMLSLLCIHEGVPGHYLQLAWSNRSPHLGRQIFTSGLFAEGWAVYVTQVMMDLGYRADDPATLLVHWKFYLRAITNAIIDNAIHAAGMAEEQAFELMIEGGFQERHEAEAKYLRARLTSTQLSTYWVGSLEMWEMELEARRRAALQAGAGADAVPQPRLVGGLGETPGFDYRAHLEAVISHGTPPIKWVRRILAEQAAAG